MKSKILALSKNEEFRDLLKKKKTSNKYVTIFFGQLKKKNKKKLNISFVTKKKLGNAVKRNKIKRRLKNIMNDAFKRISLKLDYSYEITKNSNFPFYFNVFNDYGLLWENKTTPAQSDNNIRSSAGFGIKYYSPIGPIGFTWGFPLMDEEYDIKRMFLFSVGNLD